MKKLICLCAFGLGLMAGDKLAIVNGYTITTDVAPKNFKTLPKEDKFHVINRLIQKHLASDFALKSDVIKDEKFKKSFEHIIGYSPKKSENLKDSIAKTKGYNEEQLLSKKGLLAFDFFLDKKASTFKTNIKDLKEFYEQNRYKYDTPAMVEVASIVVNSEDMAKEVEKELGAKKVNFDVFSERAKKYSLSPYAKEGGYLGKIPLKNLNDTISKEITSLSRGEYTKPIKTEFGYQIYYVINQIPEVLTTYEMVKNSVEEEFVRNEIKKWAMKKIEELQNKAEIKILI